MIFGFIPWGVAVVLVVCLGLIAWAIIVTPEDRENE